MPGKFVFYGVLVTILVASNPALGATYQVGPSRTHADLDALPTLVGGDIVEIDGDHTYPDAWLQDSMVEMEQLISRTPKSMMNLMDSDSRPTVEGENTLLISRSMFGCFSNSRMIGTSFF